MKKLIAGALIAIHGYSVHLQANEISPLLSLSVLSRIESYQDSPDRSWSGGGGLSVNWNNHRYDQTYALDTNYFNAEITYYREQDSEKYDSDRLRDSGDVLIRYQRAFKRFDDSGDSTLSYVGIHECHYNSQQLEEFERLAVIGLTLNKRLGGINKYDSGFTLGFAHSEEEKDDDLPREAQGIPLDQLNRSGNGIYFELNNRYTFINTGLRLSLDFSRYKGLWAYGDIKSYSFDRVTLGVVTPLANHNNLLHFSIQHISRDSERDLIGFDDKLSRVTVKYDYRF